MKSFLVFLNNRSGKGNARDFFGARLQQLIDKAGYPKEIVHLPRTESMRQVFAEKDPKLFDALIIGGGDGTIQSICQAMFNSGPQWAGKPVLLLPSGTQNALATSFGIHSDVHSVAALLQQQQLHQKQIKNHHTAVQLPTWEVFINDELLGSMLHTFNIGVYADVFKGAHDIAREANEYVALPRPKRKFLWSTCYNLYLGKHYNMRAALLDDPKQEEEDKKNGGDRVGEKKETIIDNLDMLVASTLPYQHASYSLTAHALSNGIFPPRPSSSSSTSSINQHVTAAVPPRLAVTLGDDSLDLWRKAHLFFREAPSCCVEQEDGVSCATTTGFTVRVPELREKPLGAGSRRSKKPKKGGDQEEDPEAFLNSIPACLVDGEEVPLLPGYELSVRPSPHTLNLIVPTLFGK